MKKSTILIISIIILLLVAGFAYWYFFFNGPGATIAPTDNNGPVNGFNPLNRTIPNSTGNQNNTTNSTSTANIPSPTPTPMVKLPALRLLSNTPVGGYGASTTANIASSSKTKAIKGTTVVRWIDRGRGNVYEARGDTNDVITISNTILPRIYESVWNKNISAFIGSMLADGASLPTTLYAQLKAPAQTKSVSNTTVSTSISSSTSSSTSIPAPYELKGKNLPDKTIVYAVSPKGDRIFMLVNENGIGVGYVSNFDGSSVTRIFSTPLTQLNVEWPEDNTIAVTTKGSASQAGFMYFVNVKTGVWKKILGPFNGLSTKTSHDAKYVIYSYASANKQDVITKIYNTKNSVTSDAVVSTLADKCAWGNFYKEVVFCGVPSQSVQASYPDDWYKGNVSFADKIWQISAETGEIHLITSIVDQSDRVIDAFNLGLDARDDFLFFMNKNDLSLWSFDLISSN